MSRSGVSEDSPFSRTLRQAIHLLKGIKLGPEKRMQISVIKLEG